MSSETSNYSLPYPVLTDPPNVPADVQALAEAVDAQFTNNSASTMPVFDSSNSVQLAADTDCAASTTVTLISSTFTLTRDQNILVGGRAQFVNQNNSTPGKVGIHVHVDGALPGHEFANGWQWADGATNSAGVSSRPTLNVDNMPVSLTAGSHTVDLVAYRGSEAVTLTAQSAPTANSHSFYPTYLTVIV